MKIITEEAVYVQKKDIAFLTHKGIEIPESIFNRIFFNGVIIVGNTDNYKFYEFQEKEVIEFFKKLDWILDYNDVKNLTKNEFIQLEQKLTEEKQELENNYSEIFLDDYRKTYDMILQHEKLQHKMYSLRDISLFNQGQLEMDLPLIPDDKGFSFTGNDECDYQIKSSIDPNKLLFYRKDGKPLSDSDRIPRGFIETAMSISIMKRQEKDSFFGNYGIRKYLSEDCKYFVIQFKVNEYDDKIKEENIEQENMSKRLVKKIKTIFKK